MVRWPAGLHPQSAKRGSSTLSWVPGWRGTGMQPITRPPVTAYTGKISGVPLTGGQVQGTIPSFPSANGTSSGPGAFATVVSVTVPAAGTYTISWLVSLAGTLSSGDANNMVLFQNDTLLATGSFPAAAGTYPQTSVTVTAAAGDEIGISTIGAGTAGSLYGGSVSSSSGGNLTLSVGPQGLGTIWYPAQVTLSTTTGPLDTSTVNVWLGSQGVPVTLVGTIFSGNGTLGLAIPDMSPGQVLICTWTGGHGGDLAAANIIGTMDALTTG